MNTASLWQRFQTARQSLALTQTATYYIAFIALGLTTASLGPTLLGLSKQTSSTLSQISFLFPARAFGYMLGSFIGGRLYDRLPGHRTMAIGFLCIALALASVPFVPWLTLLIGVFFLIGFVEAVVDVGANVLIVWVHRDRVAPFMNGLHFFFAIGAFVSPLVIALIIRATDSYLAGYLLIALLIVTVVLMLFPLPNPAPLVSHTDHVHVRPNLILLVLLIGLFVMIAGAESSLGGWIATYTVKVGFGDEAFGALVNAAFWGAFMFARLVSIPLSARVRPRVIIVADFLIALAGIVIILLFSNVANALWIGTFLFGFGIASTFPTALTFAGRHMTMTGAVTGLFFVGASIGAMAMPWFIGQMFETVGAAIVMWVISGTLVTGLVLFLASLWFVKNR